MDLWLGLLLALVAYAISNAAVSLLAAAIARLPVAHSNARIRARMLLALRLAPVAASTVLVVGFLVPSYLVLEPDGTGEAAGPRMTALAGGSLLLWFCALWRGVASWHGTAGLVRSWLRGAERLASPERGAGVYRIVDPFPVVSVVGSLRPRVFVARQVLEALTPAELEVALAHEGAHVRSRDNLKRWAMRCSPDILGLLPAGRWLQSEWKRAAEAAADAAAVRGDGRRALDLSSALLKLARLMPEGPRVAIPASALHDGEDIDYRIRLLLGGGVVAEDPDAWRNGRGLRLTLGLLAAVGLSMAAIQPGVLRAVHESTELLLRLLR